MGLRKPEAKEYWIFRRGKFLEMWDEWYRGKADPRSKGIDDYREMTRLWVLRPRTLTGLALFALILGIAIGVSLQAWL